MFYSTFVKCWLTMENMDLGLIDSTVLVHMFDSVWNLFSSEGTPHEPPGNNNAYLIAAIVVVLCIVMVVVVVLQVAKCKKGQKGKKNV